MKTELVILEAAVENLVTVLSPPFLGPNQLSPDFTLIHYRMR